MITDNVHPDKKTINIWKKKWSYLKNCPFLQLIANSLKRRKVTPENEKSFIYIYLNIGEEKRCEPM